MIILDIMRKMGSKIRQLLSRVKLLVSRPQVPQFFSRSLDFFRKKIAQIKSFLDSIIKFSITNFFTPIGQKIKTLAVSGYKRIPQKFRPWGKWALILAGFYLLLKISAWIIPLPSEALNRPSSTLIFARDGQLLHAFISSDDMWRIPTPLSQISPELQKALLGFEDHWFYLHPGINPFALSRALVQNIRSGKIVSGGSTITMQIARMMEPKKRNLGNKLWEILRAFQLELRYSKRRLLEIYFNIAPYGGNIEGAAVAAWIYFGKEPSQLSLGEAALLTVIPNSPNAYRPDLNPKRSREGRDLLLKRLYEFRQISKKAYQEAIAEEVFDAKPELPRIAPHFCRDLYLKYSEIPRISTTLDRKYQSVVEDILRLHLDGLRSEGITNGGLIILDNQSHEVLAMVGSRDFSDRDHDGQVNAVFAPRSPGSALKPFIYAQAIHLGLVSPAHYLEDVPTDFSGYSPENYDRTFSGMVSVRSALERSLNLPAVEMENRLGDKDLYSLLRQAGVSTIRSRKDYGLSIAIGGCEINLFDLTTLYSSFANGGTFTRPRQLLTEPGAAGLRLFDPGTAYIITDILTGLRRPDLPTCWEFTSLPRVAWKTGTSYGHRDAWSIGYNPRFTVGVWLGNFSGQGAPNLIGAEVATPILFEIMNYLCRNHPVPWFKQPDSVGVRNVCSLSGQLPSPDCPALMEELYLVDRSPDQVCECHQSVLIDNATGCRLPPDYPVPRKSHLEKFIQWPPRVGAWMESSGYELKRLPPLLPGWQGLLPGNPPVIRSPSLDCEYRLREGIPAEVQKICCEASAGSDVQKLYWFIDGQLLGTVKPGERLFYTPAPGRHRLVCQDNLGRQTELQLKVEKAE